MVFYRSFYDAIRELPEANQLEIFKAIFDFGLDGTDTELTGLSKTIWILIKPNIQANRTKWENGSKPKNKQNGSKTEAKQKLTGSKTEANVNVDVNVDVNEDEDKNENADENGSEKNVKTKKESKAFQPPTKTEIEEYVLTKHPTGNKAGINAFANKFWSYYENVDWKIGKSGKKMKDWRLAINTWQETLNQFLNPDKNQFNAKPQTSGISGVKF